MEVVGVISVVQGRPAVFTLFPYTTLFRSKNTHLMGGPSGWEPDHPQNKLGEVIVNDPQAIRNPRPDNATAASRVTQYGFRPVGGGNNIDIPNPLVGNAKIGTVTVTT